MDNAKLGTEQKPATAARMYDYYLGGIHNFPADRAAAEMVIAQVPTLPVFARANRAFLRRAVRHLAGLGIHQFLDLGSGIPTQGNVHEIAQQIAPESRVVYVDIDPVAVAESLEILDGNEHATAIRADFRDPDAILGHEQVRALLDFDQPIAVLLVAALHFLPDDTLAYGLVDRLVATVAPGSYLVLSHAATEARPGAQRDAEIVNDVYQQSTTAAFTVRNWAKTERFFAGTELIEPGLVWVSEWHPDPDDPDPSGNDPVRSGSWAGVGRKPVSP